MKTLQVPIEWMTAIRERRYALLGETMKRNGFPLSVRKGEDIFLLRGPHPTLEYLHRFAPATFFSQQRMPHYAP